MIHDVSRRFSGEIWRWDGEKNRVFGERNGRTWLKRWPKIGWKDDSEMLEGDWVSRESKGKI